MMNVYFRRAFGEYKRQKKLKKRFVAQTARVGSVLRKATDAAALRTDSNRERADLRRSAALLVLLPLIEVAWADGRVTHREMDAIIQAAETYRLFEDGAGYRELFERLLARPEPHEVRRMWRGLHYFMESLSPRERRTLASALLAQSRFVAEQSSEGAVGLLRGKLVCQDAQEILQAVAGKLERAKNAAQETGIEKQFAAQAEKEKALEKLIPLVPLVRAAWTEGRVTRRERQMIFDAAQRMGIEAGSPAHGRLESWLELRPTDDFYADRALV